MEKIRENGKTLRNILFIGGILLLILAFILTIEMIDILSKATKTLEALKDFSKELKKYLSGFDDMMKTIVSVSTTTIVVYIISIGSTLLSAIVCFLFASYIDNTNSILLEHHSNIYKLEKELTSLKKEIANKSMSSSSVEETVRKVELSNEDKYKKALELFGNANYEEVIKVLSPISHYKDSMTIIDKANGIIAAKNEEYNSSLYADAQVLFSEGKYEEVIDKLRNIIYYRDANEIINNAKSIICENKYQKALALFNEEKYEESYEIVKEIPEHSLAAQLKKELSSKLNNSSDELLSYVKENNFDRVVNFINENNKQYVDLEEVEESKLSALRSAIKYVDTYQITSAAKNLPIENVIVELNKAIIEKINDNKIASAKALITVWVKLNTKINN